MRRLIYDESQRVAAFMQDHMAFKPLWHPDVEAMGVEDETGQLIAGVAYERFTECDVNIHIASNGTGRWMTRQAVVAAFHYPFNVRKLRRVTGLVPSKNAQALRLDLHLGFTIEGVMRDALFDDDMIVLGLRREDCRFLQGIPK